MHRVREGARVQPAGDNFPEERLSQNGTGVRQDRNSDVGRLRAKMGASVLRRLGKVSPATFRILATASLTGTHLQVQLKPTHTD